jgi:formate dehydrogenase accessory protein FdhD
MVNMFKNVQAMRFDGQTTPIDEKIVCDEEIELVINETVSRRFSISPNSLKEFAIGYLLGEGLAGSVNDITEIKVDDKVINTKVDLADFDIRKELIVGSDCFGGWRHKIEFVGQVKSDYNISSEEIFNAFDMLRECAKVWQKTGGTHVAGLVYGDKFIAIEDVSRHVAVDKILGAAAMKKYDFSKSFIVYSGRMPADMLIKVARMGIPIIASNAAPTSSGYSVAKSTGITMIGFVRKPRFNIYTHPNRVIE